MARRAARSKRCQKNRKAQRELCEGLYRHKQDEILKKLKESTGVDVDAIMAKNRAAEELKRQEGNEEKK